MSREGYYLAINEQQTGPYSLEQVHDMWRANRVSAQTLFWRRGQPDWLPLGDMAESLMPEAWTPDQSHPVPVNARPGYYPAGMVTHYYAASTVSRLAVTSFFLALASIMFIFTWIPAIFVGHIALRDIDRSEGRLTGRGYALGGLVIGYLCALFAVLLILLSVSAPFFKDLGFELPGESHSATVATPSRKQDVEVIASGDLSRARTLSMAITAYSKDHDGMTPPDLDALFPKYVQDRKVLGDGEPGGKGTGFDYLSPNQKYDELDPDKALLLGKTESANGRKVRISNDDWAGYEGDNFHNREPDASPAAEGEDSTPPTDEKND